LLSRRTFLQYAAAVQYAAALARHASALAQPGNALTLVSRFGGLPQQTPEHQVGAKPSGAANAAPALPELNTLQLTPFVDELPLPQRIVAGKGETLRITMREIAAKVHRDVPPTRMWSYGDGALAPLIEARARQPVRIDWINRLPQHHFLPIDYTLHGCGHDVPEVRACVHLHGGRTPSKDDGQPEDWFIPGRSRTCTYPLHQDAATLWYHDHAMGLNRLNVYAGLFGMFLLRDEAEDRLNLPAGQYEIPLILYDRDFTTDGQLSYPVSAIPDHPWVSEFSADAILINGKVRPYLEVEPRLYRFRLVDAANSRFFRLSVARAARDNTPAGRNRPPLHGFHQIGSDQGLLAAPVAMDVLTIAPGERADLLIDFSPLAGQTVHLRDGAFEILQLRVSGGKPAPAATLPSALRVMPPPDPAQAAQTRTITLNEYKNGVGNSMMMLLNRMHWHEPVTETPKLGTTEIWEFVNLTEDTHPMHLHMVRFRILDRRTFDPFDYLMHKKLRFVAEARPPAANETGWKDVVQCTPGEITRVLIHFDGYAGRSLYHCHILEHEANDMMRPYEVVA
jgi:spore coat protein A